MDDQAYLLIGRMAVLVHVLDSRKSSQEHKQQARVELAKRSAELNELLNGKPARKQREAVTNG